MVVVEKGHTRWHHTLGLKQKGTFQCEGCLEVQSWKGVPWLFIRVLQTQDIDSLLYT